MPEPDDPDLRGIHVLLVDDDDDTLDVLEAYLVHVGATVTAARSGAQALGLLQEREPHVIVSDVSMPAMSGFEFMERARRLPAQMKRPTPAIALSAFHDAEHERQAFASGFHRYLRKPTDPLLVAVEIARLAAAQEWRGPGAG